MRGIWDRRGARGDGLTFGTNVIRPNRNIVLRHRNFIAVERFTGIYIDDGRLNYKFLISLLLIFFLIEKIIATLYFVPAGSSIFDLEFGFGPLIENLVKKFTFEACFNSICAHSHRMPGMPLIYSALSLFSLRQLPIAIMKNVLMSIYFTYVFFKLLRFSSTVCANSAKAYFWIFVCLFLSPNVVKHSAAIAYEEGFILELIILWNIAFISAFIALSEEKRRSNLDFVVFICVMQALFMYIIKSSMLILLFLSLLLAGFNLMRSSNFWREGKLTVVAGFLTILTIGAWGLHNYEATGRLTFMTTWDGENFYRGESATAFQVFPDVSLDQLFYPGPITTRAGVKIAVPVLPVLGVNFKNELDWNDFYFNAAKKWVVENKTDAFRYLVNKAYNLFIGIEKTPYSYTNDAQTPPPANFSNRVESVATNIWLCLGRGIEIGVLVLMAVLFRRNHRGDRLSVIASALATVGYSAPYLVGFNYERHVTVFLAMMAMCLSTLMTQWRRRDFQFSDVPDKRCIDKPPPADQINKKRLKL